jgi:hypothetical protein
MSYPWFGRFPTNLCPICGERLEARDVRGFKGAINDHMQNVHPDYYPWTRRFRVMFFAALPLALVFGLSPVLFAQSLGYGPARVLSAVLFFSPLASVALASKIITGKYSRSWRDSQNSFQPPRLDDTQLPAPESPAVSLTGDKAILEATAGVAQQLGISFNPVTISWNTFVQRGRSFAELPIDECQFTQSVLTLPEAMKGRLEAEEWKPVIASALIFSKEMRGKLVGGLLVLALVIVGLNVLGWLFVPSFFPTTVTTYQGKTAVNNNGYLILVLGGVPLSILVMAFLGMRYGKSVRLLADRRAADLLGRARFLAVLRKVQGPVQESLKKAERRAFWGGGFPWLPSTAERIEKLETLSS